MHKSMCFKKKPVKKRHPNAVGFSNLNNGSHGFSIFEMALVTIITGFLLAGTVTAYSSYLDQKKITDNQTKVQIITQAMTRFYATYGHYPCPASMSDTPGEPGHGNAMDCTVQSVASGTCGSDYCIGENTTGLRVRTGSLPFRALAEGIVDPDLANPEDALYDDPLPIGFRETIDSYGNRFTYSLTERQGTDGFVLNEGGIIIRDEYGNDLDGAADYALISHGPDGAGSRTPFGDLNGNSCVSTRRDGENCDDMSGAPDGIFIDGLIADTGDANHFDDTLNYRIWLAYYLWEAEYDDTTSRYDIRNLNTGNVGIGLETPGDRLHVLDGNVRAAASLYTNELCDSFEDGACFDPALVGGNAMADCPPGEAATGIAFGVPNCEPLVETAHTSPCTTAGAYAHTLQYDTVTRRYELYCGDDTPPSAGGGGPGVDEDERLTRRERRRQRREERRERRRERRGR